jgi:hypothetical protein
MSSGLSDVVSVDQQGQPRPPLGVPRRPLVDSALTYTYLYIHGRDMYHVTFLGAS